MTVATSPLDPGDELDRMRHLARQHETRAKKSLATIRAVRALLWSGKVRQAIDRLDRHLESRTDTMSDSTHIY
jgi:hypothetical protein